MDNLKASLRLSYTFSVFFPIIDFLSVLVMFIIINSGGNEVINGSIGIGDLFLFYSYTLRLFGPIIQISQQVAQIQAGSAATERIFSLLDFPSVNVFIVIPPKVQAGAHAGRMDLACSSFRNRRYIEAQTRRKAKHRLTGSAPDITRGHRHTTAAAGLPVTH